MQTMPKRAARLAAILLLAACGPDTPDGAAAADSAAAVPSADSLPAAADPAPAPLPPEVRAAAASAESLPTREDSIAAVREDVSPEWKQRQRAMAGYADCMGQARDTEEPLRTRLTEACSRLPDAPR